MKTTGHNPLAISKLIIICGLAKFIGMCGFLIYDFCYWRKSSNFAFELIIAQDLTYINGIQDS